MHGGASRPESPSQTSWLGDPGTAEQRKLAQTGVFQQNSSSFTTSWSLNTPCLNFYSTVLTFSVPGIALDSIAVSGVFSMHKIKYRALQRNPITVK